MATVDLTYSRAQLHMFFESEALGKYRIFPKGRRLGATRGAAGAFVEWMLEGRRLLWGDTINANIDRYFERYFVPILRQLPRHIWSWHTQKKLLKVGTGWTDFRSADNPENWEGFGYDVIFLNEAGIILDDRYLYENAVLPMLIDGNGTLIAAGTPKIMEGRGWLFRELWERCSNMPGYYGKRFTTYDNPFLDREAIAEIEREIPASKRPQEVLGEFVSRVEGALWDYAWFERSGFRLAEPRSYVRVVVGVDPNASNTENSDEMGIIVRGLTHDGHLDCLADYTIRGSVNTRVAHVVKAFHDWKADKIVVEVNNGGDWIPAAIAHVDRQAAAACVSVHATRGKLTRAEPDASKCEKGEVHHVGVFRELEAELTTWVPGMPSPNRLDAYVWAGWELMNRASVSDDALAKALRW